MKTPLCLFKDRLGVLTLFLLLCLGAGLRAQTTLIAGDIAFTGYNSNNGSGGQNDFSFVILRAGGISGGTTINFTDNGYKIAGTNALNTTEGTLVWTSTSAMAQFTQVYIKIEPVAGNSVQALSAGSIAGGFSNFILSQAGDQILAYQGTPTSPTFISAIHMNSDPGSTATGWDNMLAATNFTQNRSDMPPGLTGGVNCVAPDPNIGSSEKDDGVYNCTGATGASLAAIRTAINTPTNWSIQDIPQYTLPPSCSFGIASPLSATATGTNVTCNGASNGRASVSVSGGSTPYNYSWSPSGGSGATATGLAPGNYTVTVTDALSASATATLTITQPSALSSVISSTAASCNGLSNGRAAVTVSGGTTPYTYNWAPSGRTTALATGLAGGITHTCTITDANSCTLTQTITVAEPTAMSGTPTSTAVTCNGGTNGSASISVSGGTPSYFYSWAPSGGTGSTATGLSANNYTVTITDNNSCSFTKTVTVTQPSAIVTATSVVNVACNGYSNGITAVSASGGTSPYTYTWSPSGGNSNIATGQAAGMYTVNILDNKGCPASRVCVVTQPPALVASVSATAATCNGGANGRASVTVSGGTPGYSYTWSPSGGNSATATGLSAGIYTVALEDVNGCPKTLTVNVTEPPAMTTATTVTNASCNGGSNGTASVTVSGGSGGYTYSWAPSGGTASQATGLAAGNYTVTITDANSCTKTALATVTEPPAMTTATTVINVSCNAGSNGTASVTVSGGAGGYTYSWAPSGGTAFIATGLAAGNYTVTITDANTCAKKAIATVTQPTAISTSTAVSNVSCNGGSNGTATVTATGGTPGYTYSWAPSGGTAAVATGRAPGVYTVTVTDANSCTKTAVATITQPPAIVAAASATAISCNGGSNGRASVTVSGGTPGYTYSWAPSGGTAATATGLALGNYTVTVTDANACTKTATTTVTQPTAIGTTTTVTNVSCNGGSNGTASVTATGGTPGYTYSWAPSGGTASQATGLAAGNYTVTITDANACTKTAFATVTEPSAMIASSTSTSLTCNGGTNGTASVTVSGGTPGYTYSWAPSGGTAAMATGLAAGNYTVTITDANACTKTATANVTAPTAITTTTNVLNVTCNGGSNGKAGVAASGGTPGYTYSWAPSGASTAVVTGLAPGVHTVTITDANTCMQTAVATITEPSAITAAATATAASCNGISNGTASVTATGGTPGYTYSWAPSGGTAATATGLAAGNYTVTVMDANGCSKTATATVTEPTGVSTTTAMTAVSCNGGSNGTASVTATGGAPGYTYSWAPSGGTAAQATGLAAGNYTVTITDANACPKTAVVNVTQPTAIGTSTTVSNVSCNGGSNGTASVTVTGGTPGYTYSWAPSGGTAAQATGLAAGNYTVTITDANSCTKTALATVTQPTTIGTSTTVSNVSCNGGSNGTATVTVTGGTPGYTYSWAPSGGTAAVATGLAPGVYTVTVTDANSCTKTAVATITQPPAITAAATTTAASCNGGSNGRAAVTVSGGTPGYTYSWAPSGGTAATATGLAAGNYTVTVTDANSCTKTATATVGQPAAIATATTMTGVSCNGGANGTASVTATGGTPGYTYSWAPSGGTASQATGLVAGNYTVTITDANACTKTAVVNVTQPTAITTSTAVANVGCNGGSNGVASVTASGGTGTYTYSWAPSGGTAAAATGLTAGNYTVTITDANSCTKTAVANVTQPTAITTSTAVTNLLCNGAANGTATVTVTGGTGAYTYSWSPSGGSAAIATGLAAGNYTVTVTDANSCTKTAFATITQPAAIIATPSQTNATCGLSNGAASVSVSGGTGAYSYSWTPSGGTAATATGLASGNYTLAITDANACVKTQTFNITLSSVISGVVTATAVSCNGGNNGAASISASGGTGAYTYTWSPSGGNAATASSLTAGNYTVQVKDATSCTVSFTANVSQPTALAATASFTNVSCNGGTTGVASVSVSGGVSPYTYTWSPSGGNAAIASGLGQGNYTVAIRDNNSCSLTRTVTISEPAALTASTSQTNVACFGATGSSSVAVSGGTPAYSYTWSPSGGNAAMASGLSQGNYTVTVRDANLCSLTRTLSLSQPPAIIATATQTNVSCNGGSNGTASVSVSGGTGAYSYTWSPSGGNSASASGLSAGTYTLNIRDANACAASKTLTIGQPAVISTTISAANITCHGAGDGVAAATVGGGTGAYSYTWSPAGGNAATATALGAGVYTLTVQDANLCQKITTVSITEPLALAAVSSQTDASCNGQANGSASVTVSGGTTPYSYAWTPAGGSASNATGLAAGNYSVIIRDAHLCSLTQTLTIHEPTAIMATVSHTDISCFGLNNGTASVSASGGSGAYTYTWMPGGNNTNTVGSLAGGTYTVSVKDAASCQVSATVTVTEPAAIAYTQSLSLCQGQSVTVGTNTYTASGTYTDVLVASGGCDSTVTSIIVFEAIPTLTVTASSPAVCAGLSATLTASGATTYTWTNGISNGVGFTPVATQTYTVTGANGGCSRTATIAVVVNPKPMVVANASATLICVGQPVTLTGSGAATYTWSSPVSNGVAFNPSVTATYTVTGTNNNGCVNKATITVSVSPCTGIEGYDKEVMVMVYPNPMSDAAVVSISSFEQLASQTLSLRLYDNTGRLVKHLAITGSETQLGREGLSEGLYYYHLVSDRGTLLKGKLIVQ